MSFTDYTSGLMSKLSSIIGGDGGADAGADQRELPLLAAKDLVTILTQYSANVVHAVAAVNGTGYEQLFTVADAAKINPDRIPRSELVNSDGTYSGGEADTIAVNSGRDGFGGLGGKASISAAEYVAGTPPPGGNPWERYNIAPSWVYTPTSNLQGEDNTLAHMYQVRAIMGHWQACLDLAAQVVGNYAGNLDAKLDRATREGYYLALVALSNDLDVAQENPPDTHSIGESWSYAVNKTEAAVAGIAKDAGKAAGEIGNLAGQVAGQFGSGFFSQATFLTLAVAGVAVFVLLR